MGRVNRQGRRSNRINHFPRRSRHNGPQIGGLARSSLELSGGGRTMTLDQDFLVVCLLVVVLAGGVMLVYDREGRGTNKRLRTSGKSSTSRRHGSRRPKESSRRPATRLTGSSSSSKGPDGSPGSPRRKDSSSRPGTRRTACRSNSRPSATDGRASARRSRRSARPSASDGEKGRPVRTRSRDSIAWPGD